MIYISRKTCFSAAHRMMNKNWNKKKNVSVFGKCFGTNVHGHNYELTVTLCGEPDPESGMVFNFQKLDELINENVIGVFDHTNLNDLEIFKNKIPSSEILCSVIWTIIEKHLPGNMLYKVELKETENNSVAIVRDQPL